jgi:hypothetical protein
VPVQSRDMTTVKSLEDHLTAVARLPSVDVVKLRTLARQLDGRPVIPVLGAGGSVDCGMRLARDLASDLHDEYLADPAFAPFPERADEFRHDLGAVADAMGLVRTQDEVVEALGLHDETLWPPAAGLAGHFCAYRVLARLAREDVFAEAVTFNYDAGFEAGLHDEGFLFGPTTMRGRQWSDHATVVADAVTNAELQKRGAFVLLKVHGSADRYRHAKSVGEPPDPEEAIILRWTQLLDWRRDLWARDVLSERARRHVLLLIGFSGQDPVIHIGLTRVLEDVYEKGVLGEPRVIVIGWEPDTVTLRLLRKVGRGGQPLPPGTTDYISTQGTTTTAVVLVLLTELLALRLQPILARYGINLGDDIGPRLAAVAIAAPSMLRWSFLLRRPAPWQDYAQRINLEQAAGRGYVPLLADPHATAVALRTRRGIRENLGLTDPETPYEAAENAGFIVQPGGGAAFMPTGLRFIDLERAATRGAELEQARSLLPWPGGLDCVLVAEHARGRRGLSVQTGREVPVP